MTMTTIDQRQAAIIAKLRALQDYFNISAMYVSTAGHYREIRVVLGSTAYAEQYIRDYLRGCGECEHVRRDAMYVSIQQGNPITGTLL